MPQTFHFKRQRKKHTKDDFVLLKAKVLVEGWGAKVSGSSITIARQSSTLRLMCDEGGSSVGIRALAELTLPAQPKQPLAQLLNTTYAQEFQKGVHEALVFLHQNVWRLIADVQRDAFKQRVLKNTPVLYDDKALEDYGRFDKGQLPKPLAKQKQTKAEDGYNLWSGPNEKVVKQLPGFIMGETKEHLKALRQLYDEYKSDPYKMPRDPEYQLELVKWLEGQPRDKRTGRLKWPSEQQIKQKAAQLKQKYKQNLQSRKQDPKDSEFALVGYHTAQFRGAWEPTSDEVAKMAGKAMIPVSSTGLDKHQNPTNSVQFLREIPMVIRYANKTADKLLIQVKACEEYANSLSDDLKSKQTKAKLLVEVKKMRQGIKDYRDGAQMLDFKNDQKVRDQSATMMRKGRDAFLLARATYDKLRP